MVFVVVNCEAGSGGEVEVVLEGGGTVSLADVGRHSTAVFAVEQEEAMMLL